MIADDGCRDETGSTTVPSNNDGMASVIITTVEIIAMPATTGPVVEDGAVFDTIAVRDDCIASFVADFQRSAALPRISSSSDMERLSKVCKGSL